MENLKMFKGICYGSKMFDHLKGEIMKADQLGLRSLTKK